MSAFTDFMVGDVHARPDDLEDCEHLMEGVVNVLTDHPEVQRIWFLGDLHHTHAWVHVDVQAFWLKWLNRFTKKVEQVNIIVGNHDLAPSGNHAAQWYCEIKGVHVYSDARRSDCFAVVPYMRDKEQFVLNALDLYGQGARGKGTVLCHQTFAGAQFENGFYAPEGVSSAELMYKDVISGHIHEPQTLKGDGVTVRYLGSPRWIGLNDANSERYVYLVEMSGEDLVRMERIVTAQWCRKIVRVELTPESVPPMHLEPRWDYHVDLRGPKAWCEEAAVKWSTYGKVRTFSDQNHVVHVRESEGVAQALKKFFDGYVPPNGTPKEKLKAMLEERWHG